MKVIVVKNPDGSCSIIHPMPEMFDPESRTRQAIASMGIVLDTEEDVMNYIINKDVPEGLEYRVTDFSKLPSDRTFRDAWTDDNPTKTVDVDIQKAKEIKKEQLRQLRKPLLDALDVQYMRALEQGADTSEIVAKKQELRDVTNVTLPNTVKSLKNFMPNCLKNE